MISDDAPDSITILGSTGSIGCNTVKVISESDKKYSVTALTANSNVELLAKQAKELRAKYAVIADESLYGDLKRLLAGSDIQALAGFGEVANAASIKTDIVMSAIVGVAGLVPTMEAIKQGSKIALANKECLVCAGGIMTDAVKQYKASLIPVDSEHNAIYQVFDFDNPQNVSKIILTASGGPFRTYTKEQMTSVTPQQALAHPNWDMGSKISVDSATMMNKGLEVIEAYYLFPVEKEQIDVVIHPESIIHSMVEYHDGSVLAQLGTPDMCTPIGVALAWPQRLKINTQKLDLTKIGSLTFEELDNNRFEAVKLAKQALQEGSMMQIAYNCANEVAVEQFLNGNIGFNDIVRVTKSIMDSVKSGSLQNIDDVLLVVDEINKKTTSLTSKIVA
ncbi:MAG: 1-deoxy-D-xylulose-5-phosphate reductoisomerase [Rickettsiales bacterium]|nr:1-deoxy-D-xylulose-5-phosphate reductoisomerase [Pseudomonadota bacterium]MDA0967106.1 1-deoxy-D-xylulose-5-phosphate reductoisomerase [Pseudomonadota bacterium]MDG4542408.1 1-deoxy-D-xylulose-5-phosphate reductoisomerase [Rickettsiales bacterium]MDG4544912.1 1-deoxy-D-xylulose-5-phosphate reductoisomerase [Rickettsiales bacterium]MDG4547035.1 1-deoxy-D-xylulose-5-phosphate reductoisomerase [Rickettsiales bacterium]